MQAQKPEKPEKPELPIEIREATDADFPFILDSWRKSYREVHATRFPKIPFGPIFDERTKRLRGRANWLVACAPDDRDYIFGWICGEPPMLHYVYVKKPYRGYGVAKRLIMSDWGVSVPGATHWTPLAQKVYNPKGRLTIYNQEL